MDFTILPRQLIELRLCYCTAEEFVEIWWQSVNEKTRDKNKGFPLISRGSAVPRTFMGPSANSKPGIPDIEICQSSTRNEAGASFDARPETVSIFLHFV